MKGFQKEKFLGTLGFMELYLIWALGLALLACGAADMGSAPGPGEGGNKPGEKGKGEGDQGGNTEMPDVCGMNQEGGGADKRGGRACPCDDTVLDIGGVGFVNIASPYAVLACTGFANRAFPCPLL